MAARRLLVVTTAELDHGALEKRVREHTRGEAAELKVVVPATDVSPLQWLANDEDDARAEAGAVARDTAEAASGEVVETEVGDSDPVQAIEDGLRTFPADEVLFVTRAGDDASWLEADAGSEAKQRFGVPVTHLTVG